VVSRTLKDATCRNTTIIRDNVIESVRALKAQPGKNILTDGSVSSCARRFRTRAGRHDGRPLPCLQRVTGSRCPSGAGKTRSRRAEASAQPTHLPAVVDLVLGGMEPREVCIHCGRSAERLLQPSIIASGEALERETACLAELVNVVLERLIAKETAPLGAKLEGRLPRRLFWCGGRSLLKRETLNPTLDCSDVSQQRANRVTGVILQMIQLRNAQSFDGG
jgi:hypothetical protein